MSLDELEKEIDTFWSNIRNYGYPDQDKLIRAGRFGSTAMEKITTIAMKSWFGKIDIFSQACILWFLNGLWEKKEHYSDKEISFLLGVKLVEKDFGVYEALFQLIFNLLQEKGVKNPLIIKDRLKQIHSKSKENRAHLLRIDELIATIA